MPGDGVGSEGSGGPGPGIEESRRFEADERVRDADVDKQRQTEFATDGKRHDRNARVAETQTLTFLRGLIVKDKVENQTK